MDQADDGTLGRNLVEVMAALGFRRSTQNLFDPNYIEFLKDYATSDGKLARVRVQIDKPKMGLPTPYLSGLVVSVTKQIPPSVEAIEQDAPAIVKDDALAVLLALSQLGMANHPGTVAPEALRFCGQCGRSTVEYVVVRDLLFCSVCYGEARP